MDFNEYSQNYSDRSDKAVGISGKKGADFVRVKAQWLLDDLRQSGRPSETLSHLDVGCGVGLLESMIEDEFALSLAVDVAGEALRVAASNTQRSSYFHYDGAHLPFATESLDVVTIMCVMHHVNPSKWFDLLGELLRVLRPGGRLYVFEHNPWNLLTRLIVSRCEFDKDAVLITHRQLTRMLVEHGVQDIESRQLLYFPWRSRFWEALERGLSWLPLGAQYCITAQK